MVVPVPLLVLVLVPGGGEGVRRGWGPGVAV